MGCGGSKDKEEGINAPLEYDMAVLGVPSLDELFSEAEKMIEALEDIRATCVDVRDDLTLNSGAAAHIKPNVSHCFYALGWKIAADNNGKFADAGFGFSVESKSLTLSGKKNTNEAVTAFNNFNDYAKGLWNLPSRLEEVQNSLVEMNKKLVENADKYGEEVTEKFKDSPLKIPGKLSDFKDNASKVKKAAEIAPEVGKELASTIEFIKDIPNILKDTEKLKKMDNVGEAAVKAKRTRAVEIAWNNYPEAERYGKKPDDGVRFWENRKENKKSMKEKNKKKKK